MNFNDIYQYSSDLSVLYVEDDINLLNETKDILDDYFKEVHIAKNGLDGLNIYEEYKEKNHNYLDVIITDINMPIMDGLELIKKVHAFNEEQIVIVVSAYNDSHRLLDLIQAGITSFILKPFEHNQFMNILHKNCKSIKYKKDREKCILEKTKMASIGEMMDSIAHQWKHSLNIMKLQECHLSFQNDLKTIDTKHLEEYLENHANQINHLVETLDQFRNFFKNDEQVEYASLNEMIEEVLYLMKDRLIEHSVKVHLEIDKEKKIYVLKNEFKHVFINIINNAVDAFKDKKIDTKNRKISISSKKEDDIFSISIADNAGGIPHNVIDHIFEKDYTTKKDGSGVGLSFVVKILEKIKANISAKNLDNGAVFTIVLNDE